MKDVNERPHDFLPMHEVNRITQFLKDIGESLKLGGWDIHLAPEATDNDCIAHIVAEEQRHIASVYVCADWMQRSDEIRVNTLIHEVLHITHHDLTAVVYHVLPEGNYLPQGAMNMLQEMVRLEAEKMVDYLAGIFSAHLAPMQRWEELGKQFAPKAKAGKGSTKKKARTKDT